MAPSIATTVALRNTNKAVALVNKHGYNPKSQEDLAMALNNIIASKREQGLSEIAMIHPDRDLILSTGSSSACGCGHLSCDGNNKCKKCSGKSSADGSDSPENTNSPTGAMPSFIGQNQSTIIIIVAIVAITYIFKNK